MGIKEFVRRVLPKETVNSLTRVKKRFDRARVERLPLLNESAFTDILVNDLRLGRGDTVFVHSAIDRMNLDFPFYRILTLLREVIGPKGTVLFPTYPNHRISAYEYLLQGHTFNVRTTPSYIGLLTEFARRQPDAVRSLHPSKPVCAIGPLADELTREHQFSPYPYDRCSPYYKLVEHDGKIIGLGVGTFNLSFGYTVEDAMKESFPVRTYHERLFEVPCVNYQGQTESVKTYAQDMSVNDTHDGPRFIKTHVDRDVCSDLVINGMNFFRADAPRLFADMLRLATEGITIYPRSVYTRQSSQSRSRF
jgi:aminoglycoside 3-N-acetyltransferase